MSSNKADDEAYLPAAAAAAPQRCFPERNHNLASSSRTIGESFSMKIKVPFSDE